MPLDPASLFQRPEKSLRVAKEAIIELQSIAAAHFALGPYERAVETDLEAGQKRIKYVRRIPFPEFEIERKLNEALLATRHGFDQVAWACARAFNPRIKDTDVVYFPWADSPKGVEERLAGKSSKIPKELWSAFLSLEPHRGSDGDGSANDICRSLAQIANRKHSVGVTVACLNGAVSIQAMPGDIMGAGRWEMPKPQWQPVKNEIVVMTYPIGTRFQNQERVQFYIAFDRSSSLAGQNAIACLHLFLEKAKRAHELLCAKTVGLLPK